MATVEHDQARAAHFNAIGLGSAMDALRRWDAGDVIWSVEMGGLGPGYEQVIQTIAFECIRDLVPHAPTAQWDSANWQRFQQGLLQQATNRCAALGATGAQTGAAWNLAVIVCRHGYAVALAMPAVKDRLIQVSRGFPGVAPTPPPSPSTVLGPETLADGYRPLDVVEDE